MLKKFKQLNELDSLYLQVENLQNKNLELTDELKKVSEELEELKRNYSQLEALFMDATETLRTNIAELETTIGEVPVIVIGENPIGENVLSYHLRTSPQTQSNNYRYYYKSNYLFTAPLNLKNLLTIEFNRLMNSNLSFENVVEELRIYKQSLETELVSNGIQTDLGAVLNE